MAAPTELLVADWGDDFDAGVSDVVVAAGVHLSGRN